MQPRQVLHVPVSWGCFSKLRCIFRSNQPDSQAARIPAVVMGEGGGGGVGAAEEAREFARRPSPPRICSGHLLRRERRGGVGGIASGFFASCRRFACGEGFFPSHWSHFFSPISCFETRVQKRRSSTNSADKSGFFERILTLS